MMKPLLPIALLVSLNSSAQWSTDPAAPLQVCDIAGTPSSLSVLPDGNNGWYAFWADKRTDLVNREIYGQHLDADGVALWPANGKLIHSEPGSSINEIAVAALDNGNMVIFYLEHAGSFDDTLKVLAIDMAGDAVWPAPVRITQYGSPVLYLNELTAVTTSGGAYIGWYDIYFGGSSGVNLTRITNDGALPWGVDGYAVPGAGYGPFEVHSDQATGAVVQWRTGNGSGAALMAMRVDSAGTNVWPANVQTSLGSGGLNYAFHSEPDGVGGQLTAWVDLPHLIVMARLDTTGALTFSPSPLDVCTFASDQDGPKVLVSNGYTYVAWTDNRPPASYRDLYLQKFDADGTMLWDPDGVLALQLNTYIPTSGLIASDSGAVIATIDGNVAGYSAMRVRDDATLSWAAPVQFCTPAFNPFYAAQTQHADGEGGIVSFWQTSSNAIHAARIYRNGILGSPIGIEELAPTSVLVLHPNPCADHLTISIPGGVRMDRWKVLAMDGRVAMESRTPVQGAAVIDATTLAPGTYVVQASGAGMDHVQRFVKE